MIKKGCTLFIMDVANLLTQFSQLITVQNGIVGTFVAGLVVLGTQILKNRHTIQEMKLKGGDEINKIKISIEEKHFALTLDEAAKFREELRQTVGNLQLQIDIWQKKYYEDMKSSDSKLLALHEENLNLKAELSAMKTQFKDVIERYVPGDQRKSYT